MFICEYVEMNVMDLGKHDHYNQHSLGKACMYGESLYCGKHIWLDESTKKRNANVRNIRSKAGEETWWLN